MIQATRIAEAIRSIVDGRDLSRAEMHGVFGEMMDGLASEAQKSALLVSLRMKGETPEEIAGAALAMRERVVPLDFESVDVVDTCGTGGDGCGTFNISTAAAIVAAASGVTVAKHGNRSVSSKCGSADVLAALGVNIEIDPAHAAQILDRIGIAFFFAPKLHPAMAAVVPVRRELGLRTIFNILGPLTNPARARRQVLGVYAPRLVPIIAQVLYVLGVDHALVVHSDDGLDEISPAGRTIVAEVTPKGVGVTRMRPEQLGISPCRLEELEGGDAQMNAAMIREVLGGAAGGRREVVLANAGAAIHVSGRAGSIREGVDQAREAIDSGAARRKLDELIRATQEARA